MKIMRKYLIINCSFWKSKSSTPYIAELTVFIKVNTEILKEFSKEIPKKVKNIQERALHDGLFIQAIRYPTVPKNNDLLRINITSGHTKPQISKLLTFLSRV